MFAIRNVKKEDEPFWVTMDRHLASSELLLKIRDKRGYIILSGEEPIGVMRYNLFWDNIPFLTFLNIKDEYQRKGFGKKAVTHWENEMAALGYKIVMTSTQVDEQAQHFYRELGYIEKGCLTFDNTQAEQPMEMILLKTL